MRFMNEWDIDQAVRQWASHPILGPATRTLANLRDAANANSDGWAYWPKPARAAARLMEMIERDGTNKYVTGPRHDVSVEEYRAALRPIKTFRTRHAHLGIQFEIAEARTQEEVRLSGCTCEPVRGSHRPGCAWEA